MKKKACLFFIFFLAFSTSVQSRSLTKDIQVSLEERQIQDFSHLGLSLVFYVKIINSSSKDYYLSRYNYRLVINEKEYFRLETPLEDKLLIPTKQNILIALPVKVTYDLLFQTIRGIENEENVQCYLMGELIFSDKKKERGSLPIAFSGDIPIFKKPEFEFTILKVNAMTIGGADLDLVFKLRSRNSFDLPIERMSYDLKIGGYPIERGRISGDKHINAHSEKMFTLSLLLNFFEVGKKMSDVLQQPSTQCQLSGECEIRTIWGRFVVPFDKIERVSISKTS